MKTLGLVEEEGLETANPKPRFQIMAEVTGTGGRA